MTRFVHLLSSVLLFCLGPFASQAESLQDCRLLPAEAERLACYDGLAQMAEVVPWPLLRSMLGDPDGDRTLGNGPGILELLPGRWLTLPWDAFQQVLETDKLGALCERRALRLEPSGSDRYALSAIYELPDEDDRLFYEIRWTSHSRFAHSANLENKLAVFGIDPEKHGLMPALQIFREAVSLWTYLPLSSDLLLLVSGLDPSMQLMLRCPDAG